MFARLMRRVRVAFGTPKSLTITAHSQEYRNIVAKYGYRPVYTYEKRLRPLLDGLVDAINTDLSDIDLEIHDDARPALAEARRILTDFSRTYMDSTTLYADLVRLQAKLKPLLEQCYVNEDEYVQPACLDKLYMLYKVLERIQEYDDFHPSCWGDLYSQPEAETKHAPHGDMALLDIEETTRGSTSPSVSRDGAESSSLSVRETSRLHETTMQRAYAHYTELAIALDRKGFMHNGAYQAPSRALYFKKTQAEDSAARQAVEKRIFPEMKDKEQIDICVEIINMSTGIYEMQARRELKGEATDQMDSFKRDMGIIRRVALGRELARNPELQGKVTTLSVLTPGSLIYLANKLRILYEKNKAAIARCEVLLKGGNLSEAEATELAYQRAYYEGLDDYCRQNMIQFMQELTLRLRGLRDLSQIQINGKTGAISFISDPLYTYRDFAPAKFHPDTLKPKLVSDAELIELIKIYLSTGHTTREVNRLIFGPDSLVTIAIVDKQICMQYQGKDGIIQEVLGQDTLPPYAKTAILCNACCVLTVQEFEEDMASNIDKLSEAANAILAAMQGTTNPSLVALYQQQLLSIVSQQVQICDYLFQQFKEAERTEVLQNKQVSASLSKMIAYCDTCQTWQGFPSEQYQRLRGIITRDPKKSPKSMKAAASAVLAMRSLNPAMETTDFDSLQHEFAQVLRGQHPTCSDMNAFLLQVSESNIPKLLSRQYTRTAEEQKGEEPKPMIVIAAECLSAEQVSLLVNRCGEYQVELDTETKAQAAATALLQGDIQAAPILVDNAKLIELLVSTGCATHRKIACWNQLLMHDLKHIKQLPAPDLIQMVLFTNSGNQNNIIPLLNAWITVGKPTLSQTGFNQLCYQLIKQDCPAALFLVLQKFMDQAQTDAGLILNQDTYINMLAAAIEAKSSSKIMKALFDELRCVQALSPEECLRAKYDIENRSGHSEHYAFFMKLNSRLIGCINPEAPNIAGIQRILDFSTHYFRNARVTNMLVQTARLAYKDTLPMAVEAAFDEYERPLMEATDGDMAEVQIGLADTAVVFCETYGELANVLEEMLKGKFHFLTSTSSSAADRTTLLISSKKQQVGYEAYELQQQRSRWTRCWQMNGKQDDDFLEALKEQAAAKQGDESFTDISSLWNAEKTGIKLQDLSPHLVRLLHVFEAQALENAAKPAQMYQVQTLKYSPPMG